ncbi:MAG: hypothetical protein ABI682_00630 [Acidobacteriota bacterium]
MFLLPALLAWIVVLGEANRAIDRSEPVGVPVTAEALAGTSYSGPRIKLSAEIFESRPVKPEEFPPGVDLWLTYRLAGSDWKFEGAHQRKRHQWSHSVIDLPARTELKPSPLRVEAVPLISADFAISRSSKAEIRSKTHIRLVLKRGSLGNVWVESATETGGSLGQVTGLIDSADGKPIAFGSIEPNLESTGFIPDKAQGWIARIDNRNLGPSTDLPGRPTDSLKLADGRLVVAVREGPDFNSRAFALLQIGPGLSVEKRVGQFGLWLVTLADDGSVWTMGQNRPPNSLIHSEASGSRLQELDLRENTPLEVRDDVVVARNGDAVIRFRLAGNRLVETDRWGIERLSGAFLLDHDSVIAAGSRGLYRLSTGVREPTLLFAPAARQIIFSANADPLGNMVVSTVLDEIRNDYNPVHRGPAEHLWFLPKAEAPVDLGDVGATGDVGFSSDRQASFTKTQRVVLRGQDLYVAAGSQILGFDMTSKGLAFRIVERALLRPRRIL